jgi:hypothetical protein
VSPAPRKRNDFERLEDVEYAAQVDLYRAAPEDVRVTHAVEVHRVGMATCLTCKSFEPSSIFRRAVGIGVGHATNEPELGAVVNHMSARARNYVVPIAPQMQPAALASWLGERGFTPGYAWMKFRRSCDGVTQSASDLDVRAVGRELGSEFGRVVAEGFGMPPSIGPWLAALAGRLNWICVMAFANATPIGAGAAYIDGEYAWLGFGATLPSHRRLGAQNALLARRLGEAAARGARVAVTETGERLADKPSHSYRNILRAGFTEMYLRQNYVSPAA